MAENETREDDGASSLATETCVLVRHGALVRLIEVRDHDEVSVGRAPECTVVADDDRVSRRHLLVRWHDGTLFARDLGSRNGTLLNGRPLDGERAIAAGDELSAGPVRVLVCGGEKARERVLREGELSERLHEEVERAVRFKRPLGLVALRLDGEAPAIHAAARAIAARLGRIELVGEWAPGVCLVVMPETARARTAATAAELTRLAEEHRVVAKAGWATIPEDGSAPDQLLAAALQLGDAGAVVEIPFIVADPAMEKVFELARRAAQSNLTVLILGETGVGKELVAAEIHRAGPRRDGPLVRLNCAALPPSLVEAELFGHERGAFTGADRRRIGHIESASNGTLLLDEVGELPLPAQAKLLRVLEQRLVSRVGGTEEIEVDVRFLAATNRDLEAEVSRGTFRQDLYFRLSPFVISVPPLRERPRDLLPLATSFARKGAARMGRPNPSLSPAFVAALARYPWPGNVRELRNVIERALVLADDGMLRVEHLPERFGVEEPSQPPRGELPAQIDELERLNVVEALRATAGNRTHAARRLGISRRALLYKLKKHGLGEE